MIRQLAVFLGSRDGNDPRFAQEAYEVGTGLARRGIELVYGGGGSGLMGRMSQGALGAGGQVFGVIPRFMIEREWGRLDEPGIRMHVVETMHERKAMMAERADAFLILPGGLGTLEEFFEVWTWQTLELHAKPIGLLNTRGFWEPLVHTLHRLADLDFMSRSAVDDLVLAPNLDTALAALEAKQA